MAPLIFLLVACALLGGFLALVSWEERRGTRLFARARARLDGEMERAAFVATHVDWNSYARTQGRALLIQAGHFLAHTTLQAVRLVERWLTQAVRSLRARVASEVGPAKETSRPFVRALGDFKEELRNAHPEIPEL